MERAPQEKHLVEIEIITEEQKQNFAVIAQLAKQQKKTAEQLFQEAIDCLHKQPGIYLKAL